MLKIIFFSATLLLLPKNKWALINLAVMILTCMTMPSLVDSVVTSTPHSLMMVDPITFSLVILSVWLTSLMIIASSSISRAGFKPAWFITTILVLLSLLILTFSTSNMFLFYLFFEATLIPTLMLIMGWGYQPERIQAGVYMLFYTLAASLPLLMMIFWFKSSLGSLNFMLINLADAPTMPLLAYLAAIMAFLVKMPMFLVHLWLPKAHVEAPVSGSMILAGVLLKLGGYGLMRLSPMYSAQFLQASVVWIAVSLVGGSMVSFVCLRQTDTKSLVAYSSVAHMSLVIAGVMASSKSGATGCLSLMIAHGLCSSGMFCLTNIVFERLSSRNMMLCKGLMQIMPSMALWWFLLCICNMAAPPSLNLVSEVLLINSILSWSTVTMAPLMIMSFMSAAFTLHLFASTQHGQLNSSIYGFTSGAVNEYVLLGLHWVPINILILKADLFVL